MAERAVADDQTWSNHRHVPTRQVAGPRRKLVIEI